MRPLLIITALLACCTAGSAMAQSTQRAIDFNLNNDTVQGNFAWRLRYPKMQADVGWLHNQDRGDVIHASLHLVDAASGGLDPLQAGIGFRFVYVDPDSGSASGTAVALGGFVRYVIPRADRFNLRGYAYYAPDVISFGDMSEYYEIGAQVGYNVLHDADVYVGLRTVKADFGDAGSATMDSGLNIGFELRF